MCKVDQYDYPFLSRINTGSEKCSPVKLKPGFESPSSCSFHFTSVNVNLYNLAGAQLTEILPQYIERMIIISPLRLTCRQPFLSNLQAAHL